MFLITKCREQVSRLIKLSAHILDIMFPRSKPKPKKEFLKTAEFFGNVKITSKTLELCATTRIHEEFVRQFENDTLTTSFENRSNLDMVK